LALDLTQLRRFQLIHLREAMDRGLRTPRGEAMVTARPCFAAAPVTIPAIAHGATDLSGLHLRQSPNDSTAASTYQAPQRDLYVVADAVVHGRLGFVTSGDYLFTDFLDHAPLHLMQNVGPTPDGGWMFPQNPPDLELPDAVHVLSCNLSNYFHWNIDALARFELAVSAHAPPRTGQVVLVPQTEHAWQDQTLDLLPVGDTPALRVGPDAVIAVRRLATLSNLSGGGFWPHPGLLQLFHGWRDSVTPGESDAPGRRIYISRQDSDQRRLVNEDEVIETVRAAAYEVVTLSGMAVADQIRLFSAAHRIIAPHGAGLTNIVFSRPNAALLELHMDGYVQWSFRRLAGLGGLGYGCVIGKTVEPWHDWPHQNSWRLEIADLQAALVSFNA
jgi:capsular polysaccharide biosynthesis protein